MEDKNTNFPPPRGETFLANLTQIVLNNIENDQFGVTELCRQAGYSRSQLHRKLKTLKNKSTSQFIREIRLVEAMKLLVNDTGTSSEIAYQVGFGSPTYFNKCFHQHYGFPPGEVKKKVKRERQIGLLKKEAANYVQSSTIPDPFYIRKWRIVFILGLLAASVIIYYASYSRNAEPVSIAVLPLDNLSGNPENEYFADGVQDALIGALGMIKSLRVISRKSTLQYRGGNWDAQEIAKDLGVDIIVEGSSFAYGDSARLQLQLIQVFPKEKHLWAKDYHQEIGNVLKMQSDAILEMVNEIRIQISPEEQSRLSATRAINPENLKAYYRGMYHLEKPTKEERQKGIDFLKQAIENDPADPLAYAGLAIGYTKVGHGLNPSLEIWKMGRAAALRAIRLDSTLAEAHAALAFIKTYFEGDWIGAEKSFKRANALNPNIAENHFNYAWYLVLFGRLEEALREHKMAKDLDPFTIIHTADLGSLYWWMGRYDDALVELRQALALDSTFSHAWWSLGNVYFDKGWNDQAVKAHQKAVELDPKWSWAICNTYFKVGQKQKGLDLLSKLKTRGVTPRLAFGLATIFTTLGDLDQAFHWLNYHAHGNWVKWIRTWPGYERLREDPRYNIFLKEKNLPPIS